MNSNRQKGAFYSVLKVKVFDKYHDKKKMQRYYSISTISMVLYTKIGPFSATPSIYPMR